MRRVNSSAHPDSLRAAHNLADLLVKQGRLDEAEALFREALAGRQLALGAEHASTRNTAVGLEAVLRAKAAAAAPGARHRRA